RANPEVEIDLRGLEILARQRKGRGKSGRGGPPGTSQQNLRALLVMGHVKESRHLKRHAAAKLAIEVLNPRRPSPRRLCDLYHDNEPRSCRSSRITRCSSASSPNVRPERQPAIFGTTRTIATTAPAAAFTSVALPQQSSSPLIHAKGWS